VSLQSALAYHGLIPEHVPTVTSVTTLRPGLRKTPLGDFEYRHVKRQYFFGYKPVQVGERQAALIASPEKALLDLVYLNPGADSREYLDELRLQNLDAIDPAALASMAEKSASPKLMRAALIVEDLVAREAEEFTTL
jgi:predicted transcriptional regulator of viral defense system